MTRKDKKMVLNNYKDFLKPEFIELEPDIKLALCYFNSALGKRDSNSMITGIFRQKHLNNLSEFNNIKKVVCLLYDYVNNALNSKIKLSHYVDNLHIADTIYYVIQFLFFESRYELSGVSFLKHLNLDPEPTDKNIIKLYDQLTDWRNPIRNNILLIFIRNDSLKIYEDYLIHEIYRFNNKI